MLRWSATHASLSLFQCKICARESRPGLASIWTFHPQRKLTTRLTTSPFAIDLYRKQSQKRAQGPGSPFFSPSFPSAGASPMSFAFLHKQKSPHQGLSAHLVHRESFHMTSWLCERPPGNGVRLTQAGRSIQVRFIALVADAASDRHHPLALGVALRT